MDDRFKFVLCEDELNPKYIQICNKIKFLIREGEIEEGERLPSIRDLSRNLKVNNDTVVSAYKKLVLEGYAAQKVGSGTFAKRKEKSRNLKDNYKELLKKAYKEIDNYIDFTGEANTNEMFPIDSFKNVINEVIERDGIRALTDNDAMGFSGLRETISKVFWENKVSSEDILILSGAQQGLDVLSKAMINVGDKVILEKPTYSGALSVFNLRRAKVFEVEIENDGVNIEQLEKVLKKHKIKVFYLMSYFQNPSGISYGMEKKKLLLELAEKYDFYIIEDDYLSELIYDNSIEYKSFKALDKNDRVIYIKSFSKIYLPGIRLGYMIVPERIKESVENSKFNSDILTSSLMQRALDLYLKHGYWIDYLKKLNEFYKESYSRTLHLLDEKLSKYIDYIDAKGGLNIYLKIKDNLSINSIEIFKRCKVEGLLITPGILFYNNYNQGLKYFRISFSNVTIEEITKGIDILQSVIKESDIFGE
ncbi:MAG: PLP-dependent aminotransferase family protein [Clostridiaceae bacterium]